MPITLTVPQADVEEAVAYAERNGTSLVRLVNAYIESVVALARHERNVKAQNAYTFLMSQDDGGVAKDWHFDRDEANAR